jgi:hypothetical protein
VVNLVLQLSYGEYIPERSNNISSVYKCPKQVVVMTSMINPF